MAPENDLLVSYDLALSLSYKYVIYKYPTRASLALSRSGNDDSILGTPVTFLVTRHASTPLVSGKSTVYLQSPCSWWSRLINYNQDRIARGGHKVEQDYAWPALVMLWDNIWSANWGKHSRIKVSGERILSGLHFNSQSVLIGKDPSASDHVTATAQERVPPNLQWQHSQRLMLILVYLEIVRSHLRSHVGRDTPKNLATRSIDLTATLPLPRDLTAPPLPDSQSPGGTRPTQIHVQSPWLISRPNRACLDRTMGREKQ
ncbi:predicted protein [Plenodomus lingam JN3]|uniref:Predicted protein n=1 Tax=Leptosphaeria maculans (strain JN3 / isolate v23.1.3 / race Av1-4-5-6-7-8) TaxID=985895 RepID=E4ZNJ8_LEPMJ|nr:predicted protein [Plenodomus lingam JN3]CBX93057.1 predicted protein [Plenodomus lingam JN3]